jgi:dihydrolipoamide dehydrogenase
MENLKTKLLVIGGGPGGYVCAIRAGQLGIDTILVEQAALGGTCLNIGCIPSKALIHAADEFHSAREAAAGRSPLGIRLADPAIDMRMLGDWKGGIVSRLTTGVGALLRKAKVRTVSARAEFLDGKTVEIITESGRQVIRAEVIVIATGSQPVSLPSLPFGGDVISSTEALSLDAVPERLAVVGGGYIGLEIGTAMAKLGSSVTIIEAEERVLPLYDADLTRPVQARLGQLGIAVHTQTRVTGLDGDRLLAEGSDGLGLAIPFDKVLVTVGRRPNLSGFGVESLQLTMNGPYLRIDGQCRTSMRGVFAIGDVTGEPMLAHRAMAQGEIVAEVIAGHKTVWDKVAMPAVCFTDPEIVSVGLSPAEARSNGIETMAGQFPFRANGRAMTRARDDGFIRVLARADNHLTLGVEAVGAGVSELAAAFALAIEMGARLEDIAATIHAHPTQGEAFQEASLAALGRAIHL